MIKYGFAQNVAKNLKQKAHYIHIIENIPNIHLNAGNAILPLQEKYFFKKLSHFSLS